MRLSSVRRFCCLSLISICLSGCASLVSGTSQTITVLSEPNAEIYINDRYVGKGRREIKLKRGMTHRIKAKLNECQQTVATKKTFNQITLAGLFIDLGLISIPMDFSTGAAWKIEPSRLYISSNCLPLEP